MSVQVAVRLPDELLAFVDEQVAEGSAESRADAVKKALRREQRRRMHEREIEILSREGDDDPELSWVTEYGHRALGEIDD